MCTVTYLCAQIVSCVELYGFSNIANQLTCTLKSLIDSFSGQDEMVRSV